jgi:hypothetical protein
MVVQLYFKDPKGKYIERRALFNYIPIQRANITLNRVIRVSLDLIDPLAHDQNSRRRVRDKVTSVGTLKSSNLLGHSKSSLKISNIVIGGRL